MTREEREKYYKEIDRFCAEDGSPSTIAEKVKEGYKMAMDNGDQDFMMFFKSLKSLYEVEFEAAAKVKDVNPEQLKHHNHQQDQQN